MVRIPWSELAIALTLALAAAVVGTRFRAPIGALATAITVAGAVHEYAYGESIVGRSAHRSPPTLLALGSFNMALPLAAASFFRVWQGTARLQSGC